MGKIRKKNLLIITSVIMVFTMVPSFSFAGETSALPATEATIQQTSSDLDVEINSSRYRTVKEEVSTQTTNRHYYNNGTKANSTVWRYNIVGTHYEVYQVMVGNPDNKHFLYDQYEFTYDEKKRSSTSAEWVYKGSKHATERDRGAVIEYLGDCMPGTFW